MLCWLITEPGDNVELIEINESSLTLSLVPFLIAETVILILPVSPI